MYCVTENLNLFYLFNNNKYIITMYLKLRNLNSLIYFILEINSLLHVSLNNIFMQNDYIFQNRQTFSGKKGTV